MSRDDGGVGTVSSSVRRARSSRAGLRTTGLRDLRSVFLGARAFRRVLARLIGRLPERRGGVRLRAFRVVLARLAGRRLAIRPSFRNLDSLAISVVRSVAYRKSE